MSFATLQLPLLLIVKSLSAEKGLSAYHFDGTSFTHITDVNDEQVNANGLFAWAYEQLATLPQCEEMENV